MLILQCPIVGGIYIIIFMFNFFKEIKSNILLGILLLDTPVAHPHIYTQNDIGSAHQHNMLTNTHHQGISLRFGPQTVLAPVHSRTKKYRRRKEK